ncbi:MAG: hypothetical protein KGQ46_04200 [Hyphomicrobiales bacterium]|nr:hypothetical protein [Hyphomicrobiales bacterium]MDE2115946.1 hypothetical protein [Hyphomicrobiales bacterium]
MNSLVAVFGAPTPFTHALHELGHGMVSVLLGIPTHAHVNDFETMQNAWANAATAEGRNLFMVSEAPKAALSNLFIRARVKSIIAIEPFDALVAHLKSSQSLDFVSAVRRASLYGSLMHDLACSPSSLLITHQWLNRDLMRVISEMAEFLGLACTPDDSQAILTLLLGDAASVVSLRDYIIRKFPDSRAILVADRGLTSWEHRTLKATSHGYDTLQQGERIQQVEWNTAFFINHDQAHKSLAEPIDLIGPPRIVIFGPYLHLPEGEWEAEIDFKVTESYSKNELMIDALVFLDGNNLSNPRINFQLPESGRFKIHLKFQNTPVIASLQIRFHLTTGAIEGVFELSRVVVRRINVPPS